MLIQVQQTLAISQLSRETKPFLKQWTFEVTLPPPPKKIAFLLWIAGGLTKKKLSAGVVSSSNLHYCPQTFYVAIFNIY